MHDRHPVESNDDKRKEKKWPCFDSNRKIPNSAVSLLSFNFFFSVLKSIKSNDSTHDSTDAAATEGDSVSEEESSLIRRQRRQRAKYTSRQLHELEVEFERNPYPNAWDRETLSHKLGIHETRIQVMPDN